MKTARAREEGSRQGARATATPVGRELPTHHAPQNVAVRPRSHGRAAVGAAAEGAE
jgi:hypothetical protein